MIRLAIISDIHANLPALEAVLSDIDAMKPDGIFCLGDLVNFGNRDNETIRIIRNRNIPTIMGNHDEGIGNNLSVFPYSYQGEAQKQFGLDSIRMVNQNILAENRQFLKNMPSGLKLQYPLSKGITTLTLAHGSPVSNKEYIRETTSLQHFRELLDESNCDVLLMGHTHRPFHRILSKNDTRSTIFCHVINAGSVGKPKQGNNKACYVILTINPDKNLSDADWLNVEFRFLKYEVEKTIRHIHEAGLSDAYDSFLRTGISG